MGADARRRVALLRLLPSPDFMQASGMLLLAMLGSNLCNYLFHALASRRLGPTDYGALVSMLALLTLLAIPSQTIQTVVAQHVAVAERQGLHPRVTALMARMLLHLAVAGTIAALILGGASPWLAKFFQLSSPGPVLAVGVTLVIMLSLAVVRGWLQGLQRFAALGGNLMADGVFRLGAGLAIFLLGGKVAGGIFASALAGGLAWACAWFFLPPLPARGAGAVTHADWAPLYRYAVPVIVQLAAFMALSTVDVMLVKHFFPGRLAGFYSAASIVGKAFLFTGFALAQVMLPKASAHHVEDRPSAALMWKSLGLGLGVLGLGILLAWSLASVIVRTLFGAAFDNADTLGLLKGFGFALTPLALVYIILQYQLAIRRTHFLWLLVGDLTMLAAALWWFHPSLAGVLWVTGLNHTALLAASLILTPKGR